MALSRDVALGPDSGGASNIKVLYANCHFRTDAEQKCSRSESVAPGLGARGARVLFYCHGPYIVERPNVTPTSCFACQKHLAKEVDGWGGAGRIPMDDKGRAVSAAAA